MKNNQYIIIISVLIAVIILLSFILILKPENNDNNEDNNEETNNHTSGTGLSNITTGLLIISLEKSTYSIDEEINVTLTVTNIGDEGFLFEPFVLGGNTYFNITDSTGQRLTRRWIDDYGVFPRGLGPGQSYSQTITINGLYTIPAPDNFTIQAEIYYLGLSNNIIEFTVIQ